MDTRDPLRGEELKEGPAAGQPPGWLPTQAPHQKRDPIPPQTGRQCRHPDAPAAAGGGGGHPYDSNCRKQKGWGEGRRGGRCMRESNRGKLDRTSIRKGFFPSALSLICGGGQAAGGRRPTKPAGLTKCISCRVVAGRHVLVWCKSMPAALLPRKKESAGRETSHGMGMRRRRIFLCGQNSQSIECVSRNVIDMVGPACAPFHQQWTILCPSAIHAFYNAGKKASPLSCGVSFAGQMKLSFLLSPVYFTTLLGSLLYLRTDTSSRVC